MRTVVTKGEKAAQLAKEADSRWQSVKASLLKQLAPGDTLYLQRVNFGSKGKEATKVLHVENGKICDLSWAIGILLNCKMHPQYGGLVTNDIESRIYELSYELHGECGTSVSDTAKNVLEPTPTQWVRGWSFKTRRLMP